MKMNATGFWQAQFLRGRIRGRMADPGSSPSFRITGESNLLYSASAATGLRAVARMRSATAVGTIS